MRWVKTRDLLFTLYKFERFIEIGPSPTLTGMAMRALKAKYGAKDDTFRLTRSSFYHAKHGKEIGYQFESEIEAPAETEALAAAPAAAPAAPVAVSVAAAAAPVAALSGPVASVINIPIKAVGIVVVVVFVVVFVVAAAAQKFKKQLLGNPFTESVKDLSDGEPTFRNDIFGDLSIEFASLLENSEELPVEELG